MTNKGDVAFSTATIRGRKSELDRLTIAWKRAGDCTNRSQFIRKAINAYAGETIFEE